MLTIAGGIIIAFCVFWGLAFFLLLIVKRLLTDDEPIRTPPVEPPTPKYSYDSTQYGGVRKNY